MSVVTLTTDFGWEDPYIAMMKGRMLEINPGLNFIDIKHDIECGDIEEASFILSRIYQYFPDGTVHLVVVDPTVGSNRRPIFSEYARYFFVGPDNGVLTPFLGRAYRIDKREYKVSTTFEGRDIFAPVAAYLSQGMNLSKIGTLIDDPITVELPEPKVKENKITGEIIYVDSFGNLITNIEEDLIPEGNITVEIKDTTINGLSKTYSDNKQGDLSALINGGFGLLEITSYRRSARSITGLKKGDRITIRRNDE